MGALDFQGILEEMRLDGLEELEDEQRVRELIRQRQNYLKSESAQVNAHRPRHNSSIKASIQVFCNFLSAHEIKHISGLLLGATFGTK